MSACYVEAGIDATAGCAELKRAASSIQRTPLDARPKIVPIPSTWPKQFAATTEA